MKTKQYNQNRGTPKQILLKETKHYNQKQGTLKHYKNENKSLQSKTRNTKTLQE